MNYQELVEKLDEINAEHKAKGLRALDANWICVSFPKALWREAKNAGAKKDSYWGWVLWSTSTNTNGSDLECEIRKVAVDYGLLVRSRQL